MFKIFAVTLAAAVGVSTIAVADTAPDLKAVITNYANIAQAGYTDALTGAKQLQVAVETFLKEPTDANLKAARKAWVDARVPYMQTEGFRFGNKIVDDWEGKVNSWPLDEGFIDYVSDAYGKSPRRTTSTSPT